MNQCQESRTRSLFTATQTGEHIPKTAAVVLELCVAWEATLYLGRRVRRPRQPFRAVKRGILHCLRPDGIQCGSEVCFARLGNVPAKCQFRFITITKVQYRGLRADCAR
jgi:hypothetical protein